MKFLIFFIAIFLYSADLDFDGIEDKNDYCPRTPILAVVDKQGCSIDKKVPFNTTIELGYQYLLPKKLPSRYFRSTIYHKSYETTFYLSQINIDSFQNYTKLIDFSKRFYNSNGYSKISLLSYLKTKYSPSTYGFKISLYAENKDLLVYYKFKKSKKNLKNKNTIFISKFITYPKIIVIPFVSFENSYYNNNIDTLTGISTMIKIENFYTKLIASKSLTSKNSIFSFSVIYNY